MNKTFISGAISLLFGIAGGIGLGYILSKNKFEKKADLEIAAIKKLYEDHFKPKQSDNNEEKAIAKEDSPKKSTGKKNKGTIDYSKMYRSDDDSPKESIVDQSSLDINKDDKKKYIYLISPEEFHESEFEAKTLFYYSDKVVADEDNNVIPVPEEIIGDEALTSFGRYEEDCVYVRDDRHRVDYEILWSQLTFQEHLQQEAEKHH